MIHSGQLSERIATRSPGLTPRPARPARSLPAASEISVHEWSVQTLSRLSFRKTRAPYFRAWVSKFWGNVDAARSGICCKNLRSHALALLAQTIVAANLER